MPLLALLAGIAIALTAQYPLDGWADTSETAHWIQHGLLFFGGLTAGAGLVGLYLRGRRPA